MPSERAARRFPYSAGHGPALPEKQHGNGSAGRCPASAQRGASRVPPGMARRYRRSNAETVVPAAARQPRSAALPVFRRACSAGHGPALPENCSRPVIALQPRCGPIRPRGLAVGRDRTGLPTLGPTNFPWAEQCHAQSSEQAVFPAAVRAVRRFRAVALKAGASPRQHRTYRRFARRAGGGAGAGERGLAYSAHSVGRVLPVCFCHSAGA